MGNSKRASHRGSYILERGVWVATCSKCGWRTSDVNRRQAATIFRRHIAEQQLLEGTIELIAPEIDLRVTELGGDEPIVAAAGGGA